MNQRIERSAQARADLINIRGYIDRDNHSAAVRFRYAAEETSSLLAELPEAGQIWHSSRLADVRSQMIRDFPNYRVFYRPIQDGILILTILHGARDLDNAFDDLFRDA